MHGKLLDERATKCGFSFTFPSKVFANLGLCVSAYDVLAVEEGFIFPGQCITSFEWLTELGYSSGRNSATHPRSRLFASRQKLHEERNELAMRRSDTEQAEEEAKQRVAAEVGRLMQLRVELKSHDERPSIVGDVEGGGACPWPQIQPGQVRCEAGWHAADAQAVPPEEQGHLRPCHQGRGCHLPNGGRRLVRWCGRRRPQQVGDDTHEAPVPCNPLLAGSAGGSIIWSNDTLFWFTFFTGCCMQSLSGCHCTIKLCSMLSSIQNCHYIFNVVG